MNIYDHLKKESCLVDMKSRRKLDALEELVDLLKKSPSTKSISKNIILKALKEREELGSTGLGKGIAIPHAKVEGLEDFVAAVAVSKKGVHFDAVDNKKVRIFFVLIGPSTKPNQHLKILSAISRLLKDKKNIPDLLNAQTADILYETIVIQSQKEVKKKFKTKKQKLLIIILYEDKFLEDILELFIELGIKGSTVIESLGMGGILTKVPLFADFVNFLGQNKNYSKTILALITASELDSIIDGVEKLLGDLDKREGASIIAIDVDFAKGTMEYM